MEKSKKKSIFLDRDGVLNIDTGYTYKINDFIPTPHVIEGLKTLTDCGYLLFIITNQSGIGRGHYAETDMHRFHAYMLNYFSTFGITIEEIYFCPHTPEDGCDCRKPSTKFIIEAEKKYNVDLENSFVIGDRDTDMRMAHAVGVKSIFMLHEQNTEEITQAMNEKPTYVATTLLHAASFVCSL